MKKIHLVALMCLLSLNAACAFACDGENEEDCEVSSGDSRADVQSSNDTSGWNKQEMDELNSDFKLLGKLGDHRGDRRNSFGQQRDSDVDQSQIIRDPFCNNDGKDATNCVPRKVPLCQVGEDSPDCSSRLQSMPHDKDSADQE